MQALARAMQLAHSRNVVHRDLKPANVLLSADGTPKITDFGLARQMDSDSGETQAGSVMGTPSYMAPEQASGRAHEAGPAADIYALGAILYDCLTGRPPFKGKTVVETLDQVRTQEPVPPSRWHKSVPRDLETICLKCLHKEPEKRYASAGEFADDLARYRHGEPILARPAGRIERAVKWVKRNPVVTGAALVVVAALISGTTVSYLKYREAEHQRGIAEEQTGIATERAEEANRQTGIANEALKDAHRKLDTNSFLLAVAAYDNRDMPLTRLRLDTIAAENRGWEWHYLRRQSWGGIFTLNGHSQSVNCVAFSRDGTRIVTAGGDRTAKVWDARSGTQLLALEGLKGHTQSINSAALGPDGSWIVTGSDDRTAKVWDARSGNHLIDLTGHNQAVKSVAFSPDGRGSSPAVRTRRCASGTREPASPRSELKGHTKGVTCVAFSPDGMRIVSGSEDNTAQIWDAGSGSPQLQLKGHTSRID